MTSHANNLVSLAKQDQRHVGLSAAVSLGDLGLRHRSFERTDFGHFLARQELLKTGDAADINSVLFVGSVVYPFKIVGARIGLDAVNMVDERQIVWVGNEGEGDEAVDVDRLPISVSVKDNLRVSDAIDATSNHMTKASAHSAQRMPVNANTVNASNSSETADFVKSYEVFDVSPLFVNHLMGPFARSAHSIVVYSATQGG